MTFFADKVTNIDIDDTGGFVLITANVATGFETVQLYVAGSLLGSGVAVGNSITFQTSIPGDTDPIFLLSVDPEDADTDFWEDAFPEADANGNRINVTLPTVEGMQIGERWRVSIDGTILHEADIFPTSDGAGGYGVRYGTLNGHGPFGAGYGNAYGTNYGFGGGIVLSWTSEPLINGIYSVTTFVIDVAGNVSTADTDEVTIESYARPAKDLTVEEYNQGTDTLTISWTESEDI